MELTIKTKAFDQIAPLLTDTSIVTFTVSETLGLHVTIDNGAFAYLFRPQADIVACGNCSIAGADLLSVLQANKFRKKLRLIFNSERRTLTINSKSWLFRLLAV